MNFHELLTEFGLGHLKDIDIFGKKVNSTIDYDNTENEAEKANEIIGRVLEETNLQIEKKEKESSIKTEKDNIGELNTKVSDINEKDFVFSKTYKCPVCGDTFKNLTIKTGKARLISRNWDLRPLYKDVDCIKYDVVHCNKCGYAALTSYYSVLPKAYKDLIKKNISDNYKPMPDEDNILTYKQALKKYQLALLNSVARNGKDSEKAMICLKMAWLFRGIVESDEINEDDKASYKENEKKYLAFARVGFEYARINEQPPIAFLDEMTFDILLASLNIYFEKYNDAGKILAEIIYSKTASSHQKEKARDLFFEIRDKCKK